MDRRVKERLVGASILVLLLVLIVPELLSGPPPAGPVTPGLPVSTPEPVRNVTVELATSKPPAPEPLPTPAEAAASAASAAAGGGSTGASQAAHPASIAAMAPPRAAPPTVTTLPAAAPAGPAPQLETAASSPTSHADRAWAVQLGSFASRANVDKLVHQLKAQGFAVYVLSGGAGASVRYRVRIGPLADRGAAAQAVVKLKGLGHTASIVPPAG